VKKAETVLSSVTGGMIRIGVQIKFVLLITTLCFVAIFLLLAYQMELTSELVEVQVTGPAQPGKNAAGKINETGAAVLSEGLSRSRTEHRLEEVRSRMIQASFLVFVILSASAGLLGLAVFTRPLRRILDSMNSFRNDDARSLIAGKERDELEMVSTALNYLVSELRRSEEEIERLRHDKRVHSEKMASIGELAATVAHEIKNPLAGISGALQVLAEDFPADSPRKEIANEILDEIERLDKAVKDLLVFARPPELNLIPADINAIIDKTVRSLEPRAAEMNVEIEKVTEPVPEMMIDPDQLERALLNISLNCLHFMEGGGMLVLSSHNISHSGKAEVRVLARGNERRDMNLDDMFKPFFSTKRSGSGLGLAISKNIIESHKGNIVVEDLKEAGCMFRLIFTGRG
jgi:signal transduction histidine kinase